MPTYSLRSTFCSTQNAPDQLVGQFPDTEGALSKLNKDIVPEGKPCDSQNTIIAFTFKDSVLNSTCTIEYYLVESCDGREVAHRLFPERHLKFDPMKTTNALGTFS
jgi:hypothetical protein